jgi:hypothetical protein
VVSKEEEGIGQEIQHELSPLSRSTIQSMGIAMCWDRVLLATLAALSTIHFRQCPLAKEKSGQHQFTINLRPSPWRAARGEMLRYLPLFPLQLIDQRPPANHSPVLRP